MNGTMFWRTVWKEYRTQRPFWISMLVLVLGAGLFVIGMLPKHSQSDAIFAVSMCLMAFYALGSGATLFATERETGTIDFQRALPGRAMLLFLAKATSSLASVVAFGVAAWFMALAISAGQVPGGREHLLLLSTWGLGSLELLAWGIFFSLILSQPLIAVILAVTCASLTVHFLLPSGPAYVSWTLESYVGSVPRRAVALVVLLLIDVWLGSHWLDERVGLARLAASLRREKQADVTRTAPPTIRRHVFGRLVWQHARASAGFIAALMGMLLPAVVAFSWLATHELTVGRDRNPPLLAAILATVAIPLAVFCAPLAGAMVFLADQSGCRFRFLAERGIRGRQVWRSRHLVWGSLVAAVAAVVAALILLVMGVVHLLGYAGGDIPFLLQFRVLGFVLVAYASGQLFSMFIRSGIIAAVFSVILTGLIFYWAAATTYVLDLSWWWSVAPLPLAFLLATWLRAPDWLEERNTLRAWIGPALAIAIPTIAILAAVPPVRIYGVPKVDPGVSPIGANSTPAGAETLATYRRAIAALQPYVPLKEPAKEAPEQPPEQPAEERQDRAESPPTISPSQAAWVEANGEAIRLAMEASQKEQFNAEDVWFEDRLGISALELMSLVHASAVKLQSEGQLDQAAERHLALARMGNHWIQANGRIFDQLDTQSLLDWANRPGQTPARIGALIRNLEPIYARPSSLYQQVSRYYWLARRFLLEPQAHLPNDAPDKAYTPASVAARWFPWEQARALRALDVYADEITAQARNVDALDRTAEAIRREYTSPSRCAAMRSQWGGVTQAILWQSPFPSVEHTFYFELDRRARRGATLTLLALQAWKRERGSLPDRLDVLVGKYLKRIPKDPYTGETIRYFPEGVSIRLQGVRIEPGTPLVWTASYDVGLRNPSASDPVVRYGIQVPSSRAIDLRAPHSAEEVWESGRAYPLR